MVWRCNIGSILTVAGESFERIPARELQRQRLTERTGNDQEESCTWIFIEWILPAKFSNRTKIAVSTCQPQNNQAAIAFFVQEVRDKNVAIVRMLASLDLGYQLPSEEKLHDGMPGPFWNQPQYLFLALLIGLIIICFFPIARSWTQQPSADLLGKDLAESNETVAIMTVFLDSTWFFWNVQHQW